MRRFSVVLGLAVGRARYWDRTFNRMAAIPESSAWLARLVVGLLVLIRRASMVPAGSMGVQMALFPASQSLLAFVQRNRRLAGVLSLGTGAFCNLVVIVTNGGLMPIEPAMLVEIDPGSAVEL